LVRNHATTRTAFMNACMAVMITSLFCWGEVLSQVMADNPVLSANLLQLVGLTTRFNIVLIAASGEMVRQQLCAMVADECMDSFITCPCLRGTWSQQNCMIEIGSLLEIIKWGTEECLWFPKVFANVAFGLTWNEHRSAGDNHTNETWDIKLIHACLPTLVLRCQNRASRFVVVYSILIETKGPDRVIWWWPYNQ
jgi:hypothetical protein